MQRLWTMHSILSGRGRYSQRYFGCRSREDINAFFFSLKNNRSFSSQPVKQSDLEKILEVVGYAPSGGNNRFLRLIITKPETTKKFLELIAQWFDGDCRTDPV